SCPAHHHAPRVDHDLCVASRRRRSEEREGPADRHGKGDVQAMSPDESPAIHGTERDDFCAMFNAGDIYLFYAPKRSGKTTASLLFAWWGSKHHNYRIVSNIVLRRRDPKKFEGKGGWRHVYHTVGYDYVDN